MHLGLTKTFTPRTQLFSRSQKH